MANKFWVGAGSSTNANATTPTNWALTSGGANDAAIPTTGDAVIFDGVGANAQDNCVWNIADSFIAFDTQGYTGTMSGSSAITISGNDAGAPASVTFRWGSGMTRTYTGAVTFTGASGTVTITNNGKNFGSNVTLNGAASFAPSDGFNASGSSGLTITVGNWNGGGFNFQFPRLIATGSGTRAITLGAGTYTITDPDGAAWELRGTNITLVTTGATIVYSGTQTASRTFGSPTGADYSNATINLSNASRKTFACILSGTNVIYGALNLTNVGNLQLQSSQTHIFTAQPTFGGTSSLQPIMQSQTSGTVATASTDIALTFDYVFFQGLTKAGTGSITGTNSFDGGSNTGLSISGPSGGGTAHILGG